jgi:hypothetical protein
MHAGLSGSAQAAHLLVHPGIYVFPVLVQQLAVELLLPVPRGNSAQEKGLEFAKHGVHLLSAGSQQDKAQGICGMTNKAIWFAGNGTHGQRNARPE